MPDNCIRVVGEYMNIKVPLRCGPGTADTIELKRIADDMARKEFNKKLRSKRLGII
jgi:hypothetical protein